AALQKVKIVAWRQIHVGIDISGRLRPNTDLPEARDINHAFNVENSHLSIPPECRRPWRETFPGALVEKIIMETLAANQRPHEKELRHARIGFHVLSQDILNCFVPADLKSARPGPLNCHLWWRDHKEHVDKITKAGQQAP